MIRLVTGVLVGLLALGAALSADGIRPSPDQDAMLEQARAAYPEARDPSLVVTTVNVEPGFDGLLLRDGERVVGRYTFEDGALVSRTSPGWSVGNQAVQRTWLLLLFVLVQAVVWWRARWGWLAIAATAWALGAYALYATPYLRIAQLWTDAGPLLAAALAIGVIASGRREERREAGRPETDREDDAPLAEDEPVERTGPETTGESRRPHVAALLGILAGCYLCLIGVQAVDVAWSNLEGAGDLLSGRSIYGSDTIVFHGDTYPPLVYLMYLPGALLSPVVDMFSDTTGARLVNLLVYALVAALSWRVSRRMALSWIWSLPILLAAGSGSNDGLVAAGVYLSALGYVWAYPFAVAAKLVPLAWVGSWLREHGRRGFAWLTGFGLASALALVLVGGFDAVGLFLEGLSFQSSRQAVNDPAVLFGWDWWHPTLRGLLVLVAALAFTARPREHAWWALAAGGLVFASAQYVNALYSVWIWALAVGAVHAASHSSTGPPR